jgi:hypothetical protein
MKCRKSIITYICFTTFTNENFKKNAKRRPELKQILLKFRPLTGILPIMNHHVLLPIVSQHPFQSFQLNTEKTYDAF